MITAIESSGGATQSGPPPISGWRCFLGCFLAAAPFVFTLSVTDSLSHDEAQHLSAGALIAREGLLPYRDFPYFHTPYLAYCYSVIFCATDHLLLAGRLFSALCATLSVALLGAATALSFRAHSARVARFAVGGVLLLALSAQVFTHTAGHAWNHEPPLFCALAALLLLIAGLERAKPAPLIASGLLLGLAIGLRITYAPLLAPYGLAILVLGSARTISRRMTLAAGFSVGVLTALSGVAWLACLAPEQSWFANFEFARANITYRFATGEPRTMTLPTKLRYLFKNIVRPDFGLVLACLAPLVAAIHAHRGTQRPLPLMLKVVMWSLPFVLLGAFAPSPLFEQYFYPFVFLFLLAAGSSLASLRAESLGFRVAGVVAAGGLVISVAYSFRDYRGFAQLASPEKWTPLEVHAEAAALRAVPASGRILTLEPIAVLEAGRRIYPGFAPGPFAWRVGPFIDPAKAARLGIPTPATLSTLLAADPPAALLLRGKEQLELPLRAYAESQGYRRQLFRDSIRLWLK